MRIDPAGLPFITGPLVPAAWALVRRRTGWAAPFLALSGFMAFFFRDPDRQVPGDGDAVVSPADGRVLYAGAADAAAAPPGEWAQVSVFLSPMDVHVNRIPWGGRVTQVTYRPGRFLPAYRADAGARNEQTEVRIERDGRTVVARQIVGILARRIVCRVREGADVATGDRFGLMKFGSRMDVFLPADARLEVTAGCRVVGGETILARLPASDARRGDAA